ncbi:hypothetical protein M413DRAFT_24912 [Hebeloma cylindrosporum]|uniref:Uncharacterized protein n=1 Tax=Hebeloma cylindrosporum TaxID=76867 RepID=A0A0C3CJX8_HEBCY|nr:hypothetical protein M413DRAFT_24912 [Hebeloma cylindrosporum h7]
MPLSDFNHVRPISGDFSSTLTVSSGELTQTVLECISDPEFSSAVRARQAESRLYWLDLVVPKSLRMFPECEEIDAYRVLKAMLDHAPTERVKSAYKHGDAPVSVHPTPSLSSIKSLMTTVPPTGFVEDLRKRQKRLCMVMPGKCPLVGAHIVKRSIATNNGTWDILRHYLDLSDELIGNLENTIDSASDGMLLEISMHQEFVNFSWYFEPTATPHEYAIKWLEEPIYFYKLAGLSNSKAARTNISTSRIQNSC